MLYMEIFAKNIAVFLRPQSALELFTFALKLFQIAIQASMVSTRKHRQFDFKPTPHQFANNLFQLRMGPGSIDNPPVNLAI